MIKKFKRLLLNIFIFGFIVVNIVSFLHYHKKGCDIQNNNEESCGICFFVKSISNFVFDFSITKFFITTFLIVIFTLLFYLEKVESNFFLIRAPPQVLL
jgi:hypothetical protein